MSFFRWKSPIRGSKFERLRSTAVGAEQVSTGHLAPSIALVQQKKDIRKGCPFFVERAPSGAQSSSVFVPLRSAQSRCPPDTLRRLSLLFNKKRKIKSQQRLDNHLTFMIAYKQILGSSSHQGYDVVLFVITPAGWIYIRGWPGSTLFMEERDFYCTFWCNKSFVPSFFVLKSDADNIFNVLSESSKWIILR